MHGRLMSGHDVTLSGMLTKIVGGGVTIIGAAFTTLDPSVLIVIAGVVIYAAAAWRRDTREILRRQNEDLATRNATLEKENASLTAENGALRERPDVGKLAEIVERHDRYSKERDETILDALVSVAATITANTEAVRLWATQRAGDLG